MVRDNCGFLLNTGCGAVGIGNIVIHVIGIITYLLFYHIESDAYYLGVIGGLVILILVDICLLVGSALERPGLMYPFIVISIINAILGVISGLSALGLGLDIGSFSLTSMSVVSMAMAGVYGFWVRVCLERVRYSNLQHMVQTG